MFFCIDGGKGGGAGIMCRAISDLRLDGMLTGGGGGLSRGGCDSFALSKDSTDRDVAD